VPATRSVQPRDVATRMGSPQFRTARGVHRARTTPAAADAGGRSTRCHAPVCGQLALAPDGMLVEDRKERRQQVLPVGVLLLVQVGRLGPPLRNLKHGDEGPRSPGCREGGPRRRASRRPATPARDHPGRRSYLASHQCVSGSKRLDLDDRSEARPRTDPAMPTTREVFDVLRPVNGQLGEGEMATKERSTQSWAQPPRRGLRPRSAPPTPGGW
jgi:hypothetical protein